MNAPCSNPNLSMPKASALLGIACFCLLALAALLGSSAPSATAAEGTCPNEALRIENRSLNLPDCRAYEMVTPPYKQGYPVALDAISADGSRLLGTSLGAFAGSLGGPELRGRVGNEYGFGRGPGGWQTTALSPYNPQYLNTGEWISASADLSSTLWSFPTPPIGQDYYYVRGSDGVFTTVGPLTAPSYGPSVPPAPPLSGPNTESWRFEGASSDLSHVFYSTTNNMWPGDETESGAFGSLLEYAGADNPEPRLVGIENEGSVATIGEAEMIGQCGVEVGGRKSKFNAVSSDGETVFFTPTGADVENCGKPQPAVNEVFARLRGSETVALSRPSPSACTTLECTSASAADARFQGASRDGSKAFFTSTQQLMDEASEDAVPGDSAENVEGTGCPEAHASGCNLYLYDFDNLPGENLVLVSAGSSSPHVQGVTRISQDGSHIYFVAQGALTASPNNQGQTAQAGENNLYVFERDAQFPNGRTSFIATVAPEDEELWGNAANNDGRPAQTTPDGRFLVFQSHAQLTPDDTSSGVWQVFLYTAQSGELVRVSRGLNGFNDDGNTTVANAEIPEVIYERGSAGQIPKSLALSDDGAFVYFQSPVGLAPQALDNVTIDAQGHKANNVYVWHEGEVALISTGQDVSADEEGVSSAKLLGGSASGSDVFFISGEQLLPQDVDGQRDFYDARIGGGFPVPPAAEPCQGEVCRGPSSATPELPSPATSHFQGPGNGKYCPKGKARKGGRCVKKMHKAHHKSKRGSGK